MKIKLDEEELFELTETQKKVIMNDIPAEIFDEDMKRRLEYILMHKYERCFQRLKDEWCSDDGSGQCKLAKNGVSNIPTERDALAELIFSQPNYESRQDKIEKERAELKKLNELTLEGVENV